MIYMLLADGFEEIEALTPLDLLRRAGKEILTVSITNERAVTGAHGITVLAVSDPESGEMNISPDPSRPFTGDETVAILGENKAIDKITK